MADGAVGVGSQVLQIQALGLQAVQLDEQHGLPVLLVQQVVQTRAAAALRGLYAAQLLGQLHAGSQACLPGRNAQGS